MIPTKISEIQELVRVYENLFPSGGKTKSAIRPTDISVTNVNIAGINGMIEHKPGEYTFTAYAGTKLDELTSILTENNQYLPFDPPLGEKGATIGGTIATGLSGPGRYRYGGIRDFILGIQYIDGQGDLIRSGGKVVKNAAGFDLSKLMVGSLGQYGALVECSFKVFPKPKEYWTFRARFMTLDDALEKLIAITGLSIDVNSLDIISRPEGFVLNIRLGGLSESMPTRIDKLTQIIGDGEIIEREEEARLWRGLTEFAWLPPNNCLVKIPITPKRVLKLDNFLNASSATRHYSVGGNLAWVSWSDKIEVLDSKLKELDLSGLVIIGDVERSRVGVLRSNTFSQKLKEALDPQNKWVEV